jgi:hypothetical protein
LAAGDSQCLGVDRHPELAALRAADLVIRQPGGGFAVSEAGRAHLARLAAAQNTDDIDPFLAQHMEAASMVVRRPEGPTQVRINHAENPLAWLARRMGRDGQPLIAPEQLLAGERLRAEFTRAQLTPQVTSNWSAAAGRAPRGTRGAGTDLADTVVAARQRVRHALTAAGPEFAGLLLDVCCFLKKLDDVERERRWPARSAKVVLQLGLDQHLSSQRSNGLRSMVGRIRAIAQSSLAQA